MGEHTPGPWRAERVPTQIGHAWKLTPIGGCIYVDTRGGVCRQDAAGAEADARLIAAAPDLLAACEEAQLYLGGEFKEHQFPDPVHDGNCHPDAGCDGTCADRYNMMVHNTMVQRLHAAIAKARGT